MTPFTTRFAPSPTGFLHLGTAYSALAAFNAAKAAGGRFLLRIENTDQTRCRESFERALLEDLTWLGLDWETPVRRQSEHMDDYARALETLGARGLLYRCFKTRKEVAADIERAPHRHGEGPDGVIYRGPDEALSKDEEHEALASGAAFAWRLSVARCNDHLGARFTTLSWREDGEGPDGERGDIRAEPDALGDVILARKDTAGSYHLAVVHDDALQGVTHVVRGRDLFHATHLHVLLQALLDLPTPVYRHHRLILDKDGKRFAKRDEASTLRALRAAGTTPAGVRKLLGLEQNSASMPQ